jgi:hypothetical protein
MQEQALEKKPRIQSEKSKTLNKNPQRWIMDS